MIRWKKIKITNENKVYLEYSESRPHEMWDDFTFTCSDQGKAEFYEAFKAMAWHVVEMCELPHEDLEKMKIIVKGVSLSYGGDRDTMGLVISGARKLERSSSPLNLVTPHKPCEPYSEGQERDTNGMLSEECVDDLKALIVQAERYLAGERLQVNLFEDAQEPSGSALAGKTAEAS